MNSLLLNEKWAKNKLQKERKAFLDLNENENSTHPAPEAAVKMVPRCTLTALSACIKKDSNWRSYMKNLVTLLKVQQQQEEMRKSTPKEQTARNNPTQN